MDTSIINKFGLDTSTHTVETFGTGLINKTWIITENGSDQKYIFQRVNDAIFKKPENIAFNIRIIDDYLKANFPTYLFEAPLKTVDDEEMVKTDEGYFRVFRFVPDSHTIDVVEKPEQATEAAYQFGLFTANLNKFNAEQLKITLPDFHNLPLRYEQFQTALKEGNKERIAKAEAEIKFLLDNKDIADKSLELKNLPFRVIHHDTKISNVLLDNNDKGMCVIDLDTIMPGRFVSDLGDMMRTYLSPANEEVADFEKVEVRIEFFDAILKGYLSAMKDIFTPEEKKFIVYSGQFMIYMQALRFITDYLNNDVYYGSRYEGHNFVRGGNQISLLKKYNQKLDEMQKIAEKYS